MRILSITLCLIVSISASLFSDVPHKVSQIRIYVSDKDALNTIWETGIDFEGSSGKPGGWMEFIAGPFELSELAKQNIKFEVVHDDASIAAQAQLHNAPMNALGFGYGSMGGYYTYAEISQQLDSMKLLYPDIISTKAAFAYSNEGREMWSVKISDNPSTDEDEPEALYTALHHAREPAGMMTVIYYMWWLLENYGTDSRATYLVNNREMWFIPVVNPDGYVFNQTQSTNGGGMWRKNRRNNGNGSFGVDPNRNYGTFDMWNAPNGGSSTATGSETYRGTGPFSEPENAGMDLFMRLHNIKTCLNYHTYGRLLIYPWGYLSAENSDSLIFREFAFDMVGANRYNSGTDLQTVSYSTRGNSDDYMYGDLSKPQTYAMTPEAGTTFWPPSNQILPIALENLDANIYYSHVAGQYSLLKQSAILDSEPDGDIEPGEAFTFGALINNKGLGNAHNLQIALSTNSSSIQFSSPIQNINTLTARNDTLIAFAGTVLPAALSGQSVQVYVDITDTSGYNNRDTVTLYVGKQTFLLFDGAESGPELWNTGSGWGNASEGYTGATSFTDSPTGNYAASANNSLQLLDPLDFSGFEHVILRYWTKWAIEPRWDFALVEISTDGGTNWSTLKTSLSHTGSAAGVQSAGTWGYDGYTPGLDWTFQEIDLTSFADQSVLLRFRMSSDGADQRDGFYVDDIQVIGFRQLAQFSSLLVTDNGVSSGTLGFGESSIGTDGIDSLLGEYELLPKPGAGVFDLRWTVPSTNGANIDIKEVLGISNTVNTFTAEFQPGPSGYPVTLKWNTGSFQPGGWHLRDGLTSGSLFDINMWLDTSITISDTSVHSIEIVHTQTEAASFQIQDKWNLISLPLTVQDPSVQTVFPGATSEAWSYWGSGYNQADSFEVMKGYWIKMNGAETIQLSGLPVVNTTINIPEGWVIVGSAFCPVEVSAICGTCNFFAYSNGYVPVTSSLLPGMACWVKGPKTLHYSCGSNSTHAPQQKSQPWKSSSHELHISDAGGGKTTLYFSNQEASGTDTELPPVPPAELFDARFASQRFAESFNGIDEEKDIVIQSSDYPVTFSWSMKKADQSVYEITFRDGKSSLQSQSISGEGTLVLSDSKITSVVLRKLSEKPIPTSFSLQQNYPNPFNPATTIQFALPEQSIVTIKVYNTLGELVATPEDKKEFAAGTYSTLFDASSLSSGVYYYTLTAATARGTTSAQFTHKMLVIK